MNLFEMILFPFRWVVSAVLWVFHEMLTAIGMDPVAGITWVLCIVGLTLVMRTLTIPLFLKQIKSMRGMQELQPEMVQGRVIVVPGPPENFKVTTPHDLRVASLLLQASAAGG